MLISVTVTPKPKKNISIKCKYNPRTRNGIDNLVVVNNIASKNLLETNLSGAQYQTVFETNYQLKPAQKIILTTDHHSITAVSSYFI